MKNWTGRLLRGKAGQEIVHPQADLGLRGGDEVTPQGYLPTTKSTLRRRETLEKEAKTREILREISEILVHRCRCRIVRSFRGGGRWQRAIRSDCEWRQVTCHSVTPGDTRVA